MNSSIVGGSLPHAESCPWHSVSQRSSPRSRPWDGSSVCSASSHSQTVSSRWRWLSVSWLTLFLEGFVGIAVGLVTLFAPQSFHGAVAGGQHCRLRCAHRRH